MSQWGYNKNNGPDNWFKFYSIAKEGKRQSPIDIVTNKAKYDSQLQSCPFDVKYKCETNMELSNTGHSVKAQMSQKGSELTGGPLKDTYVLEQFHLHWGSQEGKGSEHTIDGVEYDAELHLVHYNTKYGDFGSAANKPDGLAVFGFMVKVGKSHEGFGKLSNGMKSVAPQGGKTAVDSFDPKCLFSEKDLSSYWAYLGSLTTPPLFESVTWIVFKNPMEISQEQMDDLRSLKNCEGCDMVNNYRPPQPLEGRVVSCSFH